MTLLALLFLSGLVIKGTPIVFSWLTSRRRRSEDAKAVPMTIKPGLTREKIETISSQAIALMEQEKLYLETELSLGELAQKLQLPAYQVSQAINGGVKKSFCDFINSYRVEETKRLLLDPNSSKYKILSVGFEAGFNSKTTFNTAFKKFTGFTPTDFRDRQRMLLAGSPERALREEQTTAITRHGFGHVPSGQSIQLRHAG